MQEPKRIKLTDSPENKRVNLTPLPSTSQYDIEMFDDIYDPSSLIKNNENNKQNNSQSVSELESMQGD
jgi:hypothetical protein